MDHGPFNLSLQSVNVTQEYKAKKKTQEIKSIWLWNFGIEMYIL